MTEILRVDMNEGGSLHQQSVHRITNSDSTIARLNKRLEDLQHKVAICTIKEKVRATLANMTMLSILGSAAKPSPAVYSRPSRTLIEGTAFVSVRSQSEANR